jgi:hypothetical protein
MSLRCSLNYHHGHGEFVVRRTQLRYRGWELLSNVYFNNNELSLVRR